MTRRRIRNPGIWRWQAAGVGALVLAAWNCGAGPKSRAEPPETSVRDSAFATLVQTLGGAGAYFDTDNLISNEASYLKVVGTLRSRFGQDGGVYLGVGPDQNYSYIAAIRPRRAFLIDIRRDNLLQHLLFRAIFEVAPTRMDFLAGLLGRVLPADAASWQDQPVAFLTAYFDTAQVVVDPEALLEITARRAASFGVDLSEQDRNTIRRFHSEFVQNGLDLRFNSHGRPPQWYYPTYRQLLSETDLEGRPASYLAREEDFRFVRNLAVSGRVVPLVGDVAASDVVPKVAAWLKAQGEWVSAFYTSNVEFYLARQQTHAAFARNVQALPRRDSSVVIRSVFPGPFGGNHPLALRGYHSTQTLHDMNAFVAEAAAGRLSGYWDVVTSHLVPLR